MLRVFTAYFFFFFVFVDPGYAGAKRAIEIPKKRFSDLSEDSFQEIFRYLSIREVSKTLMVNKQFNNLHGKYYAKNSPYGIQLQNSNWVYIQAFLQNKFKLSEIIHFNNLEIILSDPKLSKLFIDRLLSDITYIMFATKSSNDVKIAELRDYHQKLSLMLISGLYNNLTVSSSKSAFIIEDMNWSHVSYLVKSLIHEQIRSQFGTTLGFEMCDLIKKYVECQAGDQVLNHVESVIKAQAMAHVFRKLSNAEGWEIIQDHLENDLTLLGQGYALASTDQKFKEVLNSSIEYALTAYQLVLYAMCYSSEIKKIQHEFKGLNVSNSLDFSNISLPSNTGFQLIDFRSILFRKIKEAGVKYQSFGVNKSR